MGQIVVELWRLGCGIVESLASFDFLGSFVWADATAAGNLGVPTSNPIPVFRRFLLVPGKGLSSKRQVDLLS